MQGDSLPHELDVGTLGLGDFRRRGLRLGGKSNTAQEDAENHLHAQTSIGFPFPLQSDSSNHWFFGERGSRAEAQAQRKRTQPRCGRGIGDAVIQGSRFSATLRYVTQPPWGWECVAPGCYEAVLWPFEEFYPGI